MNWIKIGSNVISKSLISIVIALLVWLISNPSAIAQLESNSLMRQDTDNAALQPLSADELAQLNDPFFNLVLKEHSDETNLAEIETLIQPDERQRETFVVDERIVNPAVGQSRRGILTFRGRNQGEFLDPNVMLSVSFNSDDFPDIPNVEAWGWDEPRGLYNYYKLDRTVTGNLSWRFRGNSEGADTLTARGRENTCLECHVNGAPIMKELFRPWNNWNSGDSEATYLTAGGSDSWAVADNPRLKNQLKTAPLLERSIISAIRQFNSRRIDSLTREIDGTVEITEGRRLLKPLFETTEFNIISSRGTTRLHPFSTTTELPGGQITIPNSFFLNSELLAGGGSASYQGLGVQESRSFADFAQIQPEDYETILTEAGVELAGVQPGDTNFAWLVPEASHIDNDLVDQLITRGIVPREFVAAVMAINLATPVLSPARKSLFDLGIIPERFQVTPSNDLISQTIAALEMTNPSSDTPAGEFLSLLKSDDPTQILSDRINTYLNQERALFEGNRETQLSELRRLYQLAIQRRQAVLDDETLGSLDETNGTLLFPLPDT